MPQFIYHWLCPGNVPDRTDLSGVLLRSFRGFMRCVYLPILAVLSLCTAQTKDDRYRGRLRPADCEQPKKFPINSLDAFVIEINRRRRLMIDGNQQNGPSGNGNLPKGENVIEMEWSCDLEEKAIAALNSTVCPTECPTEPPNAPNGTTGFFDCQNVSNGRDAMGWWLSEIYETKMDLLSVEGARVIYRDKNPNYCNLVRYDAHRIGCAESQGVDKKCVFCLTDKPRRRRKEAPSPGNEERNRRTTSPAKCWGPFVEGLSALYISGPRRTRFLLLASERNLTSSSLHTPMLALSYQTKMIERFLQTIPR
ncbi:hypothetical protein Y032_0030g2174 [Ancylostoma ceylanicum]|uniref:SCP domain-containing protein n=2 Tax=Ancylostoma ceylanicum TaxID=53326 RepID=A0A016UQE3_9BILA|nr:hypothetical protein Y032_0030g2174 [Ancylostoma ceylanicum]